MRRPRNMARGFGYAALLAPAWLGACATYHPRPLDPAVSARALRARSLDDPRLLRFVDLQLDRPAGGRRWNLDALTLVAMYERPDLPIAAERVEQARAGEVTAAALPNPVLSLAPTYNATTVTPSPWTVGPVITELLRTAGRRPAAIAEARARAQAARDELSVTAWRLRRQVRTALIDLWAAQQRLALSRRYDRLARDDVVVVDQRYQAGMVSAATLTNTRLTANQAGLDAAANQRQERLALAALATALGMPENAVQHARLDLSGLDRVSAPGDLAALRRAALISRPELRAALARYAAAQATLRLAIARQYPDLNIGPGYHYDQGDNKFILAVSLPLPVFNQNQGPIAAARAGRRLAAAQVQQAQTAILNEIDTAATDWRASSDEARQARTLLRLARDTASRETAAFKAGEVGRLHLVGAQLADAQTELGALSAAVHQRTALGRLEDALHHPFLDTEAR